MLLITKPAIAEMLKLRKALALNLELCDCILLGNKTNANAAAGHLAGSLKALQLRLHALMPLLGIEEIDPESKPT